MRFVGIVIFRFVGVAMLFGGHAAAAEEVPWRHGIAMYGEPKYGADFKHFDYVNPNAPKGGLARLQAIGGFDTLNPFTSKGHAAAGSGLIYDTLLESSKDETHSAYASLAEAVRTPEDRSWVAFRLDADARWHDGKPVTADDLIFTFDVLMEKGPPSIRFYYSDVDRAIKVDERTVKFTIKNHNREMPLILGDLPVLPKHYWEGRDFEKTTLEPPPGSGPYRIKAVDAPRSITYERVGNYWGADKPSHEGLDNFGEIRYDYYRDATVAIEAFKAGEYDFRDENSSKHWATAYDIGPVEDGRILREEVEHHRPVGMQAFVFNTRRAFFRDARVRLALAQAFDFEWLNANLFHGEYKRTRSFFDNSELAATGLPSPEELKLLEPYRDIVPPEVFAREYAPPSAAGGSPSVRRNLLKADRLLKDAGWIIRDMRRVNAETGRPLAFEVLLSMPLMERVVLSMRRNLRRLGVDIAIRTVDTAQYVERRRAFDFDMIVGVWPQSLNPGSEQLDFWSSEAAARNGSRNYAGIRNKAVDGLIRKIVSAPDRAALVTATRALDRVLQWNHYVIPQYHLAHDRLIFWNKFGRPDVIPMRGYQFSAWWVDPAKAAKLGGGIGR